MKRICLGIALFLFSGCEVGSPSDSLEAEIDGFIDQGMPEEQAAQLAQQRLDNGNQVLNAGAENQNVASQSRCTNSYIKGNDRLKPGTAGSIEMWATSRITPTWFATYLFKVGGSSAELVRSAAGPIGARNDELAPRIDVDLKPSSRTWEAGLYDVHTYVWDDCERQWNSSHGRFRVSEED